MFPNCSMISYGKPHTPIGVGSADEHHTDSSWLTMKLGCWCVCERAGVAVDVILYLASWTKWTRDQVMTLLGCFPFSWPWKSQNCRGWCVDTTPSTAQCSLLKQKVGPSSWQNHQLFRAPLASGSSLWTKRWTTRAVSPCSGCCHIMSSGHDIQFHFRRTSPWPSHLVVPQHMMTCWKLPCL